MDNKFLRKLKYSSLDDLLQYQFIGNCLNNIINVAGISTVLSAFFFPTILVIAVVSIGIFILASIGTNVKMSLIEIKKFIKIAENSDK